MVLSSVSRPDNSKLTWNRVKSKDGITTYVANTETNGITPTRVEMTVAAAPQHVVAAITDLDNYYKWLPYCKESYTIQHVSDTVSYGYQRISAPLVTDRDVAMRCTIIKHSDTNYEVVITGVPNFIKHKGNAIRVQYLSSHYRVQSDASGITTIEQINQVDIGGNIPSFLVDWTNRTQPFETFQKLRKVISERQQTALK